MVILLGGLESRTVHGMGVKECSTAGPGRQKGAETSSRDQGLKGKWGDKELFHGIFMERVSRGLPSGPMG